MNAALPVGIAVFLLACNPAPPATPAESTVSIPDMWASTNPTHDRTRLDEVVVTSPLSVDRQYFYVQHPGGGHRSGLRVHLGGTVHPLPAPGAIITLTGEWTEATPGPTLRLDNQTDLVEHTDSTAPVSVNWREDTDLLYALTELSDIAILSMPDPTGRADTNHSDVHLANDFGASPPGYLATGILTGILTTTTRLSPRTGEDWTGSMVDEPPVVAQVAQIASGQFAEGTWVELENVVQACPWSKGDRYTVLQDPDTGQGIWLDSEGWVLSGSMGDQGSWRGEIRTRPWGPALRSWWPPDHHDAMDPILSTHAESGAMLNATLSQPTGPNALGEWQTDEGYTLINLHLNLIDLSDPLTAIGVVRQADADRLEFSPFSIDSE